MKIGRPNEEIMDLLLGKRPKEGGKKRVRRAYSTPTTQPRAPEVAKRGIPDREAKIVRSLAKSIAARFGEEI